MWSTSRRATSAAGILVIVGMVAGVLSVVPVLERADYLTRLPASEAQVVLGAIFQLVMVPATVGFALCLYPTLRRGSGALALGFLGFRLVAATCHLVAVVLLVMFLELGRGHGAATGAEAVAIEAVAELLRLGRDLTNHVAVILPLVLSDLMLFVVLHRWRLVPRWLSAWGLVAAGLTGVASLMVLGGAVAVVSPLYLLLNAPMALQSLVLAAWLIARGLETASLEQLEPVAAT